MGQPTFYLFIAILSKKKGSGIIPNPFTYLAS